MLVLNPQSVNLLGATVERVRRVAVNRVPERALLEWGNMGPYATFADVPEQRVEIELVADLERESLEGPVPGDEGELVLFTSPTAGSGGRRRVEASVVVTAVYIEVEPGGKASRRIKMAALSSDGVEDPISVTNAEDGSR
jgi:hypothetical protein